MNPSANGPRALPRVHIVGRAYFRDDRLQQFRAIHDPYDVLHYGDVAPESDLVHHEPDRVDGNSPEIDTLRQSVEEAARDIQNFGIMLWQKHGLAPQFEDETGEGLSKAEKKLNDQFWRLQKAYAEAVSNLKAEYERLQEREPQP